MFIILSVTKSSLQLCFLPFKNFFQGVNIYVSYSSNYTVGFRNWHFFVERTRISYYLLSNCFWKSCTKMNFCIYCGMWNSKCLNCKTLHLFMIFAKVSVPSLFMMLLCIFHFQVSWAQLKNASNKNKVIIMISSYYLSDMLWYTSVIANIFFKMLEGKYFGLHGLNCPYYN